MLTAVVPEEERTERKLIVYTNNYLFMGTQLQVHKFKISIAPDVSRQVFS